MTAAAELARFAHGLGPAAVPDAAREHAKLCLLDTLGIALAGIEEPCHARRARGGAADRRRGAGHALRAR